MQVVFPKEECEEQRGNVIRLLVVLCVVSVGGVVVLLVAPHTERGWQLPTTVLVALNSLVALAAFDMRGRNAAMSHAATHDHLCLLYTSDAADE